MQSNERILKIISNETINAVNNINIVTPSIYKSYFDKHALTHGTNVDDETTITDSLLDSKIQMCANVQNQSSQSAMRLSDNTTKAISAIREKDDVALNQILIETNNLRKEIEKLKEAVYKDELTHTYNRKWIHDKFLDTKMTTLSKMEL